MFIPNNFGIYTRFTSFNSSGEPLFGAGQRIPCAVVSLVPTEKKSPIRSDSSASRGNADEDVTRSNILIPHWALAPRIDDKFEIAGASLRFISVQPRFSVLGNLDHYDCDLEAWPEG